MQGLQKQLYHHMAHDLHFSRNSALYVTYKTAVLKKGALKAQLRFRKAILEQMADNIA
jgi:hypothetical protein